MFCGVFVVALLSIYILSFVLSTFNWTIIYAVFTAISSGECLDPGGVANASYTITGLSIGSTVAYACDPGYQYEAGYLTRSCQSDGTWDGVPPVCSGMFIYFTSIKYYTNNGWTLSEKWKIITKTVLILISQSYHHAKGVWVLSTFDLVVNNIHHNVLIINELE